MTVNSAAPRSAPLVYTVLIIVGVLAAMIGASLIGIITYNYVTREELRNPIPREAPGHSQLPAWIEIA